MSRGLQYSLSFIASLQLWQKGHLRLQPHSHTVNVTLLTTSIKLNDFQPLPYKIILFTCLPIDKEFHQVVLILVISTRYSLELYQLANIR